MAGDSPIEGQHAKQASPLFSDNTYDKLKFLITIVLPALATLYSGLAALWNFPHVAEVVGTLALAATFLGVLLGFSSRAYSSDLAQLKAQGYDGVVNVLKTEVGAPVMSLELNDHPSNLIDKDQVLLKVTGALPDVDPGLPPVT